MWPLPLPVFAALLVIASFPASGYGTVTNGGLPERYPLVSISIRPDFSERTLRGIATVTTPEGMETVVELPGLSVGSISRNGTELARPPEGEPLVLRNDGGDRTGVSIEFSLGLPALSLTGRGEDETLSGSFMEPDTLVLVGPWHPRISGLARYELSVELPRGLTAVSEADEVNVKGSGELERTTFVFAHPREGVAMAAGPYMTTGTRYNDIEISGYFFPEDVGLMERYIEKAKDFITRYEQILGPYPFKRFAVVENRAPTGYGFSTFTLIGQQVARLPFIVDTSLGHEIVHSWFGNSVYVDYDTGNWCEGLTTYFSDYLYRLDAGQGAEYRKELLVDYASFVKTEKAFPLSVFRGRTDRASKAVGYGKGAMVFHMLRAEIGEEAFLAGTRSLAAHYLFRRAGWADLEKTFEEASGRELDWFFRQWLDRDDLPALDLKNPKMETEDKNGPVLTACIVQKNEKAYRLTIPVVVETRSAKERYLVTLVDQEEEIRIPCGETPARIILDPGCDIMRTLAPDEFSPVLSRLLGAGEKTFLVHAEERGTYAPLIGMLESTGFKDASDAVLPPGSVAVLGRATGIMERFTGPVQAPAEGVLVMARENPVRPGDVIVLVKASSREELAPVVGKLVHYGKYTKLVFQNGMIREKETDYGAWGMEYAIEERKTLSAVATRDISSLDGVLREIADKRVVFVGEQHDRFSHHLAQLEVISGLHRMGRKIAVGMEMFQQPFQSAIDSYLKRETNEKDFLKGTEYFLRWGFDYQLYRPIVDYCHANGIPIIALNVPAEISKKVGREGIGALTGEELDMIPSDLDWSGGAYREKLMAVFAEHPPGEVKSFENFFQAQVLWDEGMAEAAHRFLSANKDTGLVVLAGIGHVAEGLGIPARLSRRGGYDQAILVPAENGFIDPVAGDYLLFPSPVPPPFTPKLGVMIDEKDGNGPTVRETSENGPAHKAGIRAGDIIVRFQGEAIATVADLKTALIFVKENETASVTIRRDDETFDLTVGPFTDNHGQRIFPHGAVSPHESRPRHP